MPPWRYTAEDLFTISAADWWYDLTASANTSDGFLRRFTGHVENGAASVTDPAS
ncbi:hypothetical protein [Amycolatopsis sp. NPDC059657]|uniref:hypothetical protein n=1 Tax=Amycolatopsis sp. NPDC059657 TaxID=3346899 RepID=UPI00366FEAD0